MNKKLSLFLLTILVLLVLTIPVNAADPEPTPVITIEEFAPGLIIVQADICPQVLWFSQGVIWIENPNGEATKLRLSWAWEGKCQWKGYWFPDNGPGTWTALNGWIGSNPLVQIDYPIENLPQEWKRPGIFLPVILKFFSIFR